MKTGFRGTFVISWSQTLIDGYDTTDAVSLGVGSTWRWTGQVVQVDGHGGLLRLEDAAGSGNMRRRAARTVRKLVGAVQENTTDVDAVDVQEPLAEQSFAVTDGRRAYVVTVIDVPGARPLAMFLDDIPPRDQDLWVVEHALTEEPGSAQAGQGQMICFTPGTRLKVATGEVDVTRLRPGDLVQTKDNGLQEVCGQDSAALPVRDYMSCLILHLFVSAPRRLAPGDRIRNWLCRQSIGCWSKGPSRAICSTQKRCL